MFFLNQDIKIPGVLVNTCSKNQNEVIKSKPKYSFKFLNYLGKKYFRWLIKENKKIVWNIGKPKPN